MPVYYVGWPTDSDGDTLWFVDCSEAEAKRIEAWMWSDGQSDLITEGWIGVVRPDSFEKFREYSGMKDDEEEDAPAVPAGD